MSKYKINYTFFLSIFLISLFFLISKNFFLFYTGRFFDGCDMMWSPSALFLKNLNVFEIYFSNLRNIEIEPNKFYRFNEIDYTYILKRNNSIYDYLKVIVYNHL